MAKVSIIIPNYNHSEFLTDRLQTIVNQTYKDWEAIIIDDKSTDASVQIIEKFLEENPIFKIKHFIKNTQNSRSGYYSWKKGIELAQTEYIWIAETDDYSDLTFLEEQISVLEQNKSATLSFCTSNYVENEKIIYNSTKRTKDLNVLDGESNVFNEKVLIDKMPFNTYITNGSAVLFRKPLKPIPEIIFNNKQTSDLFLWTFLIQNSDFIFLNKKLNFFRRHETSTTTINNKENRENLYYEYVAYLNYFQSPIKTIRSVIYDYILNFVFAKENKKSYFYLAPLKKIASLNRIQLYSILFKMYVQVLISKINMKLHA